MTRPLAGVLLSVLLPFALAHFVSYVYRNVNTVVYPDLVRDIGLDAHTLGLLTGAYFIAFAVAQLPVGMALDRFGPRRVQLPMLAVAALGGVLFAQAQSLEGLLAARALIGLGVSASLMAVNDCGKPPRTHNSSHKPDGTSRRCKPLSSINAMRPANVSLLRCIRLSDADPSNK